MKNKNDEKMNHCQSRLNPETERYLEKYYHILDQMIKSMEGARLKDSISYNFIVQMVPHHMAAIEMSENLLAYCSIPELKEIAEGIITEQTRGIGDMLEIEEECERCQNTHCQLNRFQGRINQIKQLMFFQMRHAYADNNISCNFIREMIPHHMGAVRMSKTALEYELCPGLVPILQSIITSQEHGILQMRELARKNSC